MPSEPLDRPTPNRRSRKKHAQYAAALLTAIGFIANTAAIVGLVLDHMAMIVITAAFIATFSGLYLLLRRWGKPVDLIVMVAVLVMMAGSVTFALGLEARSQGQKSKETNSTATVSGDTSTSESGSASDGKPVSKNTNHTVVFEREFTLKGSEGLELDDEKGTIRVQQSEAKAPIDLYLSSYPSFSVSVKKFYEYQPPATSSGSTDKDEYTSCKNLVETSQLGTSSISAHNVTPDQKYCIITTRGRIALITMREMVDGGYDSPASSIDFVVKLWN